METDMDDHAQDGREWAEPPAAAARTPYARPLLKVYGNIAALTRAVGTISPTLDVGGMGGRKKTH
jgi:hypothetical protein